MKPTLLALAAGFATWLVLASAHGQVAAPDGNCNQNPACRALFEQAQQQSKAGQLAAALRSYTLAFEVIPDPRLLFSMGRVLHKQTNFAEAIPYYRRFIESGVDDESRKSMARTFLSQCEAALPPPASPSPSVEAKPVVPEVPSQPAGKLDDKKQTPLYRRAWFWTLLGGIAAAGIAGGIAGGVIAHQNRVPMLTFRPFE